MTARKIRTAPVKPASVETLLYRYPVETPVRTSFGVMHDRPALFVRIADEDGTVGWGEVWCNFPSVGAEHRARLIESALVPRLIGKEFETPAAAFEDMTNAVAVLAIQSGEHGPLAQSIAGLDMALWDLAARKLGEPLWRMLGGSSATIAAYASGLNPDAPEKLAIERQREGHRNFKLKVGFGIDRDTGNLKAMRAALGNNAALMADANQAWTLAQAREVAPRLEEFGLRWLEEPLRADQGWNTWADLKQATKIPLAAGENLLGDASYDAAIASKTLRFVQPDLGKWGGFTRCLDVAERVNAAGLTYCPHWLGGGIGLLASAHLLAAVGGDGLLEIDANSNPLRDELSGPLRRIAEGRCTLSDAPGLGEIPDLRDYAPLREWLC
jgi:L-alanine-DL-glutamate epimerase-like enolase superfamily enzyme